MAKTAIGYLAAAVAVVVLASAGWCGTAVVGHLYQDHLLIDGARAAEQQRLQNAAQQLQQMQQQAAPKPPQ